VLHKKDSKLESGLHRKEMLNLGVERWRGKWLKVTYKSGMRKNGRQKSARSKRKQCSFPE